MAVTATIMGKPWTDGANAYLAVSVAEGGAQGNKEYIGSVSLTADLASVGFPDKTWGQLSAANKLEAMRVAVKAARDAQQAGQGVINGISGTVTI